MIKMTEITLPAFPRGFHLITGIIEEELHRFPSFGLLQIFIMHTSAGLSLNENADPSVRYDLSKAFDDLIPENKKYSHSDEGMDDMPAHIKATLTGSSLMIPVKDQRFCLGTWQGIYLCEFRNKAAGRKLTLSFIS